MPENDRSLSPVVVKKYANRRLYDTESSIYITLETLADMVRQGRDFVVYDAKTGDDITRAVLTQIIVEEEVRGRNMLPTSFLRQLISLYGDRLQGLVPDYLETIMEQFRDRHPRPTALAACPVPALVTSGLGEAARQNVAVMERSISLFPAIYRAAPDTGGLAADAQAEAMRGTLNHKPILQDGDEVAALQEEILRLRQELARATSLDEPADRLQTAGRGVRH